MIKKLLILVIGLLLYNCNNEVKKSRSNTLETEEINSIDSLDLHLNNGEKWIVNNATQIGVTKMDSTLQSFTSNKDDNYLQLGNNLSKQTSFIIKSCDMTGEAHDQLHVILVPMLDEIYVLKDSQNLEEHKSAVISLGSLINTYYMYFTN